MSEQYIYHGSPFSCLDIPQNCIHGKTKYILANNGAQFVPTGIPMVLSKYRISKFYIYAINKFNS